VRIVAAGCGHALPNRGHSTDPGFSLISTRTMGATELLCNRNERAKRAKRLLTSSATNMRVVEIAAAIRRVGEILTRQERSCAAAMKNRLRRRRHLDFEIDVATIVTLMEG
jgi:hypothetical protein